MRVRQRRGLQMLMRDTHASSKERERPTTSQPSLETRVINSGRHVAQPFCQNRLVETRLIARLMGGSLVVEREREREGCAHLGMGAFVARKPALRLSYDSPGAPHPPTPTPRSHRNQTQKNIPGKMRWHFYVPHIANIHIATHTHGGDGIPEMRG